MRLDEFASNTATIVCGHVFSKEREVRLVTWDDEGLCMLCGEADHDWESEKEARLIGVGHLFARQAELKDLSLEIGQEAEKVSERQWVISVLKEDS